MSISPPGQKSKRTSPPSRPTSKGRGRTSATYFSNELIDELTLVAAKEWARQKRPEVLADVLVELRKYLLIADQG